MNSKQIVFSFGEHVRSLREELKLSLREVAASISVDPSLLGKIERDERQPTNEQIKLLAIFYKVDEHKLIMENLSDQIAYKIIDANAETKIFYVAEEKVKYLKNKK